jgi:hypothetical protein
MQRHGWGDFVCTADFPVCRIAGFPTRRPLANLSRPPRERTRRSGNPAYARTGCLSDAGPVALRLTPVQADRSRRDRLRVAVRLQPAERKARKNVCVAARRLTPSHFPAGMRYACRIPPVPTGFSRVAERRPIIARGFNRGGRSSNPSGSLPFIPPTPPAASRQTACNAPAWPCCAPATTP